MTSLLRRIWAAGDVRKSRFHDEKGRLVAFAQALHAPAALATTILRVCFGRVAATPWLGYSAVDRIKRILQPTSRVLEFGSGRSTAWFAGRTQFVYSVEHDAQWIAIVQSRLKALGLDNAHVSPRTERDYADVPDQPDGSFDFALVDGLYRDRCVATALRKVRKGGSVYLDNSDKHPKDPAGETRVAERLLVEAAARAGSVPEYFLDFASGQFFVNEGLLVKI